MHFSTSNKIIYIRKVFIGSVMLMGLLIWCGTIEMRFRLAIWTVADHMVIAVAETWLGPEFSCRHTLPAS